LKKGPNHTTLLAGPTPSRPARDRPEVNRRRQNRGRSNGNRSWLWKLELAKFAAETGLEIVVCHFPQGTSKWNKI